MEGKKRSFLGAVLPCLLLQQITGGLAEWELCQFDFTDKEYYFSVPKSLDPGTVVGQVVFNKCDVELSIRYISEDPHFQVQADGSIVVMDHVNLNGPKWFLVLALEQNNHLSQTTVTLREQLHHEQLRRQKRDWVVPPISASENERGPFPKRLMQVKSNRASEMTVYYSITGQGADSPPVGTFVMERHTGWISVTRQLDREQVPSYTVFFHAVSSNGQQVENPIENRIKVTDQNDNHPFFTQAVFEGTVPEGSKPGTPVMTVTATDLDDTEESNHGIVRYFIVSQDPSLPNNRMFTINSASGLISVLTSGLDRELYPQYNLILQVIDQEGAGYETTGKAVITVKDSNDNPPIFNPLSYSARVPEKEVGVEVALLTVTDDDLPNTDAWRAVFKIIKGNEGNHFDIRTTPDNVSQLTTIKGLDFEVKRKHILLIVAKNIANFSVPVRTSTATVTVDVEDVNEPPVFVPPLKDVSVPEYLPISQEVTSYTVQDPDKTQNQRITYYIGNDPAGWLTVNPENGLITGKGQLDRESIFVKNNIYRAIILAVDQGVPPSTGTGTLQISLIDVNDNGPYLESEDVPFCQYSPHPLFINIIDKDLPPFTGPYTAKLINQDLEKWTATALNNQLEIKPIRPPNVSVYSIPVIIADSQNLVNVSVLRIHVQSCMAVNSIHLDSKAPPRGQGIPGTPEKLFLKAIFRIQLQLR